MATPSYTLVVPWLCGLIRHWAVGTFRLIDASPSRRRMCAILGPRTLELNPDILGDGGPVQDWMDPPWNLEHPADRC